MITRILLGLTGSDHAGPAIQQAIDLAKRHSAVIQAVAFCNQEAFCRHQAVPVGGMAYARQAQESLISQARRRIANATNNFEGLASAAGIEYEVSVEEREPIEALSDHWRFCDIVVFARRSLFDQGLVDEPVGTLNRMISLGIRPTVAAASEDRTVKKAIAALSGSTVSAKVFKRFCQMKPWGRIPVDLVHIGEDNDEARRLLSRTAAFALGHGIEVGQQLVLSGSTAATLIAAAESTQADAVILGDSSRTLLARRILGDVALEMVRDCPLPLFLSH